MTTPATNPFDANDHNDIAAIYYGLHDRLDDHGHAVVNVVSVTKDWASVTPADIESTPDDAGPADMDEARRMAVLVDHIDGCDPETSILLWLDAETGAPMLAQIAGPDHDGGIAKRIIGRDIGAEPPAEPEPTDLQKSVADLTASLTRKPEPANDNRQAASTFLNAADLLGMDFPPVKYTLPGYVAEGLTILGGRPKLGKSWLALGACVAVATGGDFLGKEVEQGDAFYLALEDNARRLQDRLRTVLPAGASAPDMSRLSFLTEAPRIDAGLLSALDEWRKRVDDPRLVVIDTLAMVRPAKKRTQDSYEADYAALSPLQKWAGEHRLALVVVTHVRKMEAQDPLEMISGTNGLTGAADSIMVLNRDQDGSKLYGRGRDIEEVEKALRFDKGVWTALGDVADVKRSDQRQKIIDAMRDANLPMGPADIAKATGIKVDSVRHLLPKLVAAGEVEKLAYGTYRVPEAA
ncbi:AAA family ATPase [uncultured Nitratireductor sp.]|uniref:AAA family ATPase n=1 Tax=uncultured Nitratireductor sp. TaxID=520953 RepID=UPI002617A227|nr:AAA family ATPase [uncultured Nitratireductor sp.]